MCIKPRAIVLANAFAALCGPAVADSLGFRFAELSVSGGGLAQAHVSTDFAITGAHGVQLDLGAVGYADGFLGQIDAHLYLMPTDAAKYGLYFSLADVDGREATIASLGVEAMFALSGRTEVHGRAGLGMANPGHMEFITASLGASHALGDQVAVFGDVMVTEVDEAALRAVGVVARLGVSYQPLGQAWEVTALIAREGATGRDAAAFETRAELGFTWHLGAGGGARRGIAARGFASPQPTFHLRRSSGL